MTYQEEIRYKYPDELSTDTVRCILRINTNRLFSLLQTGTIKNEIRNINTHEHIIKKDDLISYLDNIKCENPTLFINDTEKFREWIELEWHDVNEVLTNKEIAKLIGYPLRAINKWMFKGNLKSISMTCGKLIPKEWLIEFYISYALKIRCKRPQHIALLKRYIFENQL